jgi:DtxR family Mn-dependent transcriptional regulator
MKPIELSASLEDYLEAILASGDGETARAHDVARRLGVRAASVTGALRALSRRGLIEYHPYAPIRLTPSGRTAARHVERRHRGVRDFLVRVLGVERGEAERCACRIEHVVSDGISRRLAELARAVPPGGGP